MCAKESRLSYKKTSRVSADAPMITWLASVTRLRREPVSKEITWLPSLWNTPEKNADQNTAWNETKVVGGGGHRSESWSCYCFSLLFYPPKAYTFEADISTKHDFCIQGYIRQS